jgi:hypothetical protein
MRTQNEIQRAHDILHSLASGELDIMELRNAQKFLHLAHDVLGWVLGFPCEDAFADNLAKVEAAMRRAGVLETNMGEAKVWTAEEVAARRRKHR